jgi:hypothetical protein
MGAAVPQSTTKKIRKKKKFCSWTICSIRFDYSPPSSERIHSIYSLVFPPRSDECVQKKDFLGRKVSTSERGVYLIEMKLAPSLPIKRFALDQAKVTYKRGYFFSLGFLLAPDTITSSRSSVPFTISCATRSDG